MIRLTDQLPRAPWRMDFDGLPHPLWMMVRPPSSALSEAAGEKSRASVPALLDHIAQVQAAGGEVSGFLNLTDPHVAAGMATVAYAAALAELAVVEWGGAAVEDPATGQVVPPSPAAIADLMLWPGLPATFIHRFLAPLAKVSAEGNGLGAVWPGKPGAAPIIADPAPMTAPPAPAAGGD